MKATSCPRQTKLAQSADFHFKIKTNAQNFILKLNKQISMSAQKSSAIKSEENTWLSIVSCYIKGAQYPQNQILLISNLEIPNALDTKYIYGAGKEIKTKKELEKNVSLLWKQLPSWKLETLEI